MNYVQKINETLLPKSNENYNALDLFAGCGGLSLGFEAENFETIGYEMEQSAVDTYNTNLNGQCITKKLTVNTSYQQPIDIIIGGPPCQPFSVGGQQKGIDDERNGFPIFIDAVKQLKPKLWLFENVRGMLYSNKLYFEQIIGELSGYRRTFGRKLFNRFPIVKCR